MTVLQFGETGQVGRELLRRSDREKFRLSVYGRKDADFTHPHSAADLVRHAPACDVVVNAVGYTAVDKAESDRATAMTVNAEAVGKLAQACAERGVPLIHLSTDYVFDGISTIPYQEGDPTNPVNCYGSSKLRGENSIRAVLPSHVILRTSWVYSPYGTNFLKTMIRLGIEREHLRVVSDQIGAPTAASDIADTIFAIIRRLTLAREPQLFGTFHYSGKGQASWFEFAAAILAAAKPLFPVRARLEAITTAQYPTPAARPRNSLLNCDKIETRYDIRPKAWEDSMREVISRLTKNGGET
jgi:dTDP-4-dehydrorhamnose reductase